MPVKKITPAYRWFNQYATGPIAPSEMLRAPKGTICIYECKGKRGCHRFQNLLHGNAKVSGAKFKSSMLYAFNIAGDPSYLVRAEIVQSGKAATQKRRSS